MKKIVTFLLILLWSIAAIGQAVEPTAQPLNEDYLQKSKKQKTAAWILLGGGAALTIGGAVWWGQEMSLFSETTAAETASVITVLTGIGSMVASVPWFIASGRNKRRAEAFALNLKLERSDCLFRGSPAYPAMTLVIKVN